jgi:hypothetical protein
MSSRSLFWRFLRAGSAISRLSLNRMSESDEGATIISVAGGRSVNSGGCLFEYAPVSDTLIKFGFDLQIRYSWDPRNGVRNILRHLACLRWPIDHRSTSQDAQGQ